MSKTTNNNNSPKVTTGGGTSKKQRRKRNRKAPGPFSPIGEQGQPIAYVTKPIKVTAPRMSSDGKCTVVKHRELIGTVGSSNASGWEITAGLGLNKSGVLRANPGSASAFPWLSGVAINFERYKFRKLSVRYVPKANVNQSGDFNITPDYDAADANPTSEQIMASNVDTVQNLVFRPMICHLQPARMNRTFKEHYVMSDTRFISTTQDVKTIDVAKIILSDDVNGAVNMGKIWMEYEVELHEPQAEFSPLPSNGSIQNYNAAATSSPITGINAAPIQQIGQALLTNLPGSATNPFPTSILGTFLQPFSGVIDPSVTGTGLNLLSGTSLYPSLNGVPVVPTTNYGNILNGTNTLIRNTIGFNANPGDVLSIATLAAATTLSNYYATLSSNPLL